MAYYNVLVSSSEMYCVMPAWDVRVNEGKDRKRMLSSDSSETSIN